MTSTSTSSRTHLTDVLDEIEDPILRQYAEAAARQLRARHSVLAQIEAFEPNWMTGGVHQDICKHLDGIITLVERGEQDPGASAGGPRLILQTPPGIGKTLMSGVHLISNALGRHPDWHFIYATYNSNKAEEVGGDTRQRIEDPRFQEIHPECRLDASSQAKNYMMTTRGGKVSFVGIGGGSLGKRAHIMVVDDPFADEQEGRSELHQLKVLNFVLSTAESRLHPYGAIVVIHQRWHVEDLIGRLIALSVKDRNAFQWTNCKYPMVATEDCAWRKKGDSVHKERFSNAWCEKTKATKAAGGLEWIWSAMYQQEPTLDSGMFFKRKYFDNKIIPFEKFPTNLNWYVSVDFAATANGGDHYVVQTFGIDHADNIYFRTPWHMQVDPDVGIEETFNALQRCGSRVVFVEKGVLWNASKGSYRQQQEKRRFYPRVVEFARSRAKRDHSTGLLAHMAAGKVYWEESSFLTLTLIPQFMAFTGESGVKEEDDLVDACALPFLSWLEIRRPQKDVELPDVPKVDPITQQMLDVVMAPARPPKDPRSAWTAADINDLEPGEQDFSDPDRKDTDRDVLPRLW